MPIIDRTKQTNRFILIKNKKKADHILFLLFKTHALEKKEKTRKK